MWSSMAGIRSQIAFLWAGAILHSQKVPSSWRWPPRFRTYRSLKGKPAFHWFQGNSATSMFSALGLKSISGPFPVARRRERLKNRAWVTRSPQGKGWVSSPWITRTESRSGGGSTPKENPNHGVSVKERAVDTGKHIKRGLVQHVIESLEDPTSLSIQLQSFAVDSKQPKKQKQKLLSQFANSSTFSHQRTLAESLLPFLHSCLENVCKIVPFGSLGRNVTIGSLD